MSIDVAGKTVLITGANRGIGKAILESMLAHGAEKVYAAVRTPSSMGTTNSKVVTIELDLSKPETITAAAATASDAEIVINNAGVLKPVGPLDAAAFETLAFEMDVNVYGLLRMAQAFAPVLKLNGGGAFVQLNSIVSMKAFPAFTTYCASKAAAYSITQSLRDALGEQGTHVLSVHPGPIATDMGSEAGLEDIADPPSMVSEGIITALKSGVFHLFPDTMAQQVGSAYASFAENIVEANLMEG